MKKKHFTSERILRIIYWETTGIPIWEFYGLRFYAELIGDEQNSEKARKRVERGEGRMERKESGTCTETEIREWQV